MEGQDFTIILTNSGPRINSDAISSKEHTRRLPIDTQKDSTFSEFNYVGRNVRADAVKSGCPFEDKSSEA